MVSHLVALCAGTNGVGCGVVCGSLASLRESSRCPAPLCLPCRLCVPGFRSLRLLSPLSCTVAMMWSRNLSRMVGVLSVHGCGRGWAGGSAFSGLRTWGLAAGGRIALSVTFWCRAHLCVCVRAGVPLFREPSAIVPVGGGDWAQESVWLRSYV